MLFDFVEVYFSLFGKHKHSSLRERHLLDFRAPWQIADGVKIFTVAIPDAFYFNRT